VARGHGELLEDARFLWRQTRTLVVAKLVDQMTASILANAATAPTRRLPRRFTIGGSSGSPIRCRVR
jgi:hypothetical protein